MRYVLLIAFLSISLPLSIHLQVVELTYCRFVQSLALVKKMRNILGIMSQESILYEILNACK